MASLTHVCIWEGKGWRRITAEEAARLHPGGTVSAHSGLFMCELCGQYVMLTDGSINVRHFRHSSSEKSKDCPERTFGPGYVVSYNSAEHDLPIRIVNISSASFSFEMGLIRIPDHYFNSNIKIEIQGSDSSTEKHVYSAERINPDKITYVSIGSTPNEDYYISIINGTSQIKAYWPEHISGINSYGTLFDAKSGKKLPYDADVVVDKEYYLLTRSHCSLSSHVRVKEMCKKTIGWNTWWLYSIRALDYAEETAKFFLDYHCRLSDTPISINPVWPVYVKEPYLIKHNGKSIYLHIKGNATTTSVFPSAHKRSYSLGNSTIVEIACSSRQQLITAGRSRALQYSYFWQDELDKTNKLPNIVVSDITGKEYKPGTYSSIPPRGLLSVKLPFDGSVICKKSGRVIEKRKIAADVRTDVLDVSLGSEVSIYLGMDLVWQAEYRRDIKTNSDETLILERLRKLRGRKMLIPSSIGQISSILVDYPEIQQWIYSCIRKGSLYENAYKELKAFTLSLSQK